MNRIILIISILFAGAINCLSQELSAKLTINSQKVQTPNKDIFVSLERDLNKLLNEQRWTETAFMRSERIQCIVSITINEMPSENSFNAEIQITARRPVYNSTYMTSTLNYRDTNFEFNYMPGQSLDFAPNDIRDNLIAVIAYYAYVIIGLDFDSFSMNGGKPYFAQAMNIANAAQSLNTKGWETFSGSRSSRYDLALALSDDSYASFHSLWYSYHRKGLDEMAANPTRGRLNIIESMADLQKIYDSRSATSLLVLFGEAKLEELVKIASGGTEEEKKDLKAKLLKFYPAKSNIINQLK